MRKSAARKPAKPLSKPSYFPEGQVLTRTMPPELAGQREFEEFHFIGFDFSQTSLSGWRFTDCRFENCNLAGTSIANTAFQNVAFDGCKLLGLPFQACRDMLFAVHFDHCQLAYASFHGRSLPNTRFVGCSMQEVDFTHADLTQAVFQDCQLRRAVFRQSKLNGTDFSTAQEVTLDPALNEVKNARFALSSLPGLLTQFELDIVNN
ncbi:pentapeptide repeat-containing protein [Hymenobacter busanensis]|uniref:Pentapeptide repeat-containing protein n=1 Tax=Hymenobacter busanensis TaxID=2607656 RepID=A0A7L5A071_9BACT|nr:pentapeptide repeat-containing protein [Hymenobacter busanensis]KAA9332921.1 pentapeptide repeat-containing protein [Hymenobacter busanensis]QHJ08405.1 pentapeptide repeat-containing protein [Hymenobacter busanensis]